MFRCHVASLLVEYQQAIECKDDTTCSSVSAILSILPWPSALHLRTSTGFSPDRPTLFRAHPEVVRKSICDISKSRLVPVSDNS